MSEKTTVSQLLRRHRDGDSAAMDELLPLIYQELQALAQKHLWQEGQTSLQPVDLVHEAYLRLSKIHLSWEDRTHFMSMSSRVMRRVLVDRARARQTERRGGGAAKVSLSSIGVATDPCEVLELHEALKRLSELDRRLGSAIELHYFGGLNYEEIALAIGGSTATVGRDLRLGRAWLRREFGVAERKRGD